MIIHNPILTGSFTVNGTDVASITSSAASITAINNYTASQNILNGTYATTGSNTFAGIQTINSNLVVTGSITAQTLVVQTITSSVDFVTGSTRFGSISANTHNFTGSVLLSGSFGLNKAVPQRQYTQVANANGIVFAIQNAAASNEGYIVGFDAIGSTYLQLSDSANAAKVYLNSSGSSYFTGGSVGIGTSTITNGTFFGAGNQINRLKVQGAGYTCLEINGSSSGGSIQFTYGIDLPNQVGALIGYNYASGASLEFSITNVTNGPLILATSGSERMRITSAGNIQIDSGQLNTPKSLSFQANSNTGGNLGSIDWYNFQWDGLLRAQIKGETDTGLSNGRLVFSTGAGGVTERMRISSTGVVTKPFQPLAMGGMAENQSVAATTFTSIAFNTSYGFNQANVGSCWNNSTSTFTAPATGTYLINAGLFTSNVGQIAAFINGNRTISMVSTTSTFPTTWHGTIMIKLTSGDALTLRGYGDASGVITQNTYHTWFGIYFLG
jgi:hypothetical protein